TRQSVWRVAIVAPSGENAKPRIGASPTPRTRLAGIVSLVGPKIGSQGRTMIAGRSRAVRLRFHRGSGELLIRDGFGPCSAAPGVGPKSVVSLRMGDFLSTRRQGKESAGRPPVAGRGPLRRARRSRPWRRAGADR